MQRKIIKLREADLIEEHNEPTLDHNISKVPGTNLFTRAAFEF